MKYKKQLIIISLLILVSFFGAQLPDVHAAAFQTPVDYPIDSPSYITKGDFNNDLKTDLAVTSWTNNNMTVFLGDGSGGFTALSPRALTPGTHPNKIVTGYFNSDSNLDIAIAIGSPRTIIILFGDGDGNFTSSNTVDVGSDSDANALVPGFFDGDSTADIAVLKDSGYPEIPDHVRIFSGDGAGTFTSVSSTSLPTPPLSSTPIYIIIADFDADSKADLAIANLTDNTVTILLGNGDGSFTEAAGSPIAVGTSPVTIFAADLNNDNIVDLAVANYGSNTVSVLLGNGSGGFSAATGSPLSSGLLTVGVTSADFNLDGNADLAVTNNSDGTVSVFEGNGDGTFNAKQDFNVGTQPGDMTVADFNGDGRPDIASVRNGNMSVLINEPQCVQPPSGMVSWWGGDNNALDMVGLNNGTLMGGVTYASGKVGQAFSFDGAEANFVEIPNSAEFNPSGAFSVDGWFYLDPAANAGRLVALVSKTEGSSGQGWVFWLDDRGGSRTLSFSSGSWAGLANAIPTANWYHVAGVFDPATTPTTKLYLNGEVVATANGGLGAANAFNVRIGASYWTDSYYPGSAGIDRLNGKADEVEFFNRALTAEEIAAIYNAGSAGKCRSCVEPPSNMISWWQGEDNADDIIGTNNGAMMNGATFTAGKVGQAFSLDGVDDYVNIPNIVNGWAEGTIGAWVNFKDPQDSDNHFIFSTGATILNLYKAAENDFRLEFGTYAGAWWVATSAMVNAGQWHHVAATWGPAGIKIYLDGLLSGTNSWPGPSCNSSYNMIGARASDNGMVNALVDEFVIFDRALSASEIVAIYNAGNAGTCEVADTTPDAFSFTDVTNAALNTEIPAVDTIIVSGVNAGAPISITSCTSTLCEYEINGSGSWTDVSGTVSNGDTVKVRQTSSVSKGTTTDAVVTIGGVSDTFSVTTVEACLSLPSGSVAWWRGENNAIDSAGDSAGANNGTLINSVTYAAGHSGNAFELNGTDQTIAVPDGIIPQTARNFTVGAWVFANSVAGSHFIFYGGANTGEYYLYAGDGIFSFGVNLDGSGGHSVSSPVSSSPGAWYYVAGLRRGTAIELWVDGSLQASTTIPDLNLQIAWWNPGQFPSRIGAYHHDVAGDMNFWSGLIDEVILYNSALTASEMVGVYDGTCAPDIEPDSFTFTEVNGAALSTVIPSVETITVSGINTVAPISIAVCSTTCEYQINGGAWTSAAGSISEGDEISARQTSSSSYSTTTDLTLDIGGVTDTFSVTTGVPNIAVTLASMPFGLISLGSISSTQQMTISNTGNLALTVSQINKTGSDLDMFSVTAGGTNACGSLTPVIAAGDNCTVVVSFSPSSVGAKNAALQIISDDQDMPTSTVTLSGTGYATLTVTASPAIGGTVTGSGIACGSDCSENYTTEGPVQIEATPATGWRFLRWEGSLTGNANPGSVTMSAHRSLTAVFATDIGVCTTCSIQAAIDAANPGDVVKVAQGMYYENIVIDTAKELTVSGGWNSDFTLQSTDPTKTVIDGDTDGDGIGDGSVIYISAGKDITFDNMTIMNGYAAFGGGILFWASTDGQRLEVRNCIIRENGGGIAAYGPVTGVATVELKNTLIVDNATTNYSGIGASTLTPDSSLTMRLENCTISDNRALNGGGLMASADSGTILVEIANSIIWGNRKSDLLASDIFYNGLVTINVLNSDVGTVESGGSGSYADFGGNISSDPVFINPAFLDYRLNNDSPAIDAGDNASASGLSTDIMGQSRVTNGTVDMGAHEYQPTTPSIIKLLSLNSGEIIDAGMPYDITWEAPASAQSFKVLYSMDNGLTWVKAVSADLAVTGNIVTGQQHFRWNVPMQLKNKKTCKIKVIGYTGPNATGAKVGTDISDLSFILRAVGLVRPNGPDPLHYGENYLIRWVTTEKPAAEVTSVKLSYTTNGGLTWKAIGSPITGNPGSYSWAVPTFTKAKTKCKVKVDLYSGATKVGSDTSDYFFTIGP